jgi:hypothetical protein
MQQCTFCGAYLAEKSLACSRCGRNQLPIAQFTPFEEGTSGSDASTARESVHTGLAQGTQSMQQKTGQFQPYQHSYFLPQQPQQPQYPQYPQEAVQSRSRQEVSIQQHREQGTFNANASRKVAMPKWIMAVIAVLVIAGGAGAFVLISHTPGSSVGKGATYTIASNNGTQSATGSTPTGSTPTTNTHAVNTSKGTTTTLTCSESGSHTGTFTFTGVVAGTISLSTFQACNSAANTCYITCIYASKSGGHTYFGKAQGKINGVTYQFEFLINPYSGPGMYSSTGNTNVVLMRNNYEWETYGATSNHTSIVVNANGKTGSIRATISMMSPQFDPTNMVIVTGNWSQ